MPIGSRFSMEQTTIELSFRSRISSSSYSFQPTTDSSTNTSFMGLASIPRVQTSSSSVMLLAMPPPLPPRVPEGLIISGKPIASAIRRASRRFEAKPLRGTSSPAATIASLNSSRSSAFLMALRVAPMSSTL